MANSNSTLSLVFLLLLLFAKINTATSTSYGGIKSMRSKIDSKKILHEIIFDLGKKMKMQITNRRALVDITDRVAPGGPDPKHH
ncbi:hypothetical protein RND71_015472 [Anisodus tanguticus]|uniref:Uncharacterized protein n=1 Tax=Anisodus tanguticus TaxID=243964 RepID=A0AAE1S6Y6_9SOLA|nr:hypothetical protein RND71_015472 [Anisodus tanguticus]